MHNILTYFTLFLYLFLSNSITSSCNNPSDCPDNAYCQTNSMCACKSLYILDCETSATELTSDFEDYDIKDQTKYFITIPSSLDVYYSYVYEICSEQRLKNYELNASLWVNGGQDELTSNSYLGSGTISTKQLYKKECVQLQTPLIIFEEQPNGKSENLILGVVIEPISSDKEVDNQTLKIEIKVQEVLIIENDLLFTLAIVIVSVIAFAALVAIGFCFWKRWRMNSLNQLKVDYQKTMIENFQNQMPIVQAKTLNLSPHTTCTVCLGEFEPTDQVRNLICGHIFHANCIDSWCKKNLSCPTCRFQLDEASIEMKKKQLQKRSNGESINVELQEMTERPFSKRSNMRQSILQRGQTIY